MSYGQTRCGSSAGYDGYPALFQGIRGRDRASPTASGVWVATLVVATIATDEALEAYRQALALNPLDKQLDQKVTQLEAEAER